MIDLAGSWTLSAADGDHCAQIAVPGDVVSALHDAGLVADPYYGRNEYDLRWIGERDWVLSREIYLDRTDVDLVIEMLDTIAEVRVNGVKVMDAGNMFRTHRADISGAARVGSNDVEIHFRSPVHAAAERAAAQPFPVPWSTANCPIPHGNMLRKPQCDFGWDWNVALASSGVYGEIRLEPHGPRIDHIQIAQQHEGTRVTVTATARLKGAHRGEATFRFAGQEITARAEHGHATAQFILDDPDLWWPAGWGAQTLHELAVTVSDHTQKRSIGLRRIELDTTPDGDGSRFAFRVNGRELFARGANWIPADALAGRITKDATRELLQSAKDANMNMIRVWGGGRYEPDWFYDLCDELGLLVWQDFMFACHLYPSTSEFLEDIAEEVKENALRLHHHACLALWCGDNELLGALGWFEESRHNRDRYLVSYDRLNRTIETALKSAVPEAIWWPSSPSPGPMSFGDAWHDDRSGDMHFWSVWHEGRDFDHYRDVSPRFCSEFGFQSYPSNAVIAKFTDPSDRNIASPVMESHQKNRGGNARIAETMFRYFRFPEGFENFVYLSQVQQGLAIQTAVSHWRSLKPHCMGALYWQLNDTWPVCSWSSLDHGGGWKLLHHMAARFFAPVYVTAVPTAQGIEIRAVNDRLDPVDLSVTLGAARMDGIIRPLRETDVAVTPEAARTVTTLAPGTLAEDEILALTWSGSDGTRSGDVFAPRPWKAYDLLPSDLSHSVAERGGTYVITIEARALAPFTAVETDTPGRFSMNAVHLFPGHPATITFTPAQPGHAPRFTLRDLHSATYPPERTE